VALCNVNAVWQGVSVEVCKAWLTEALSAVLADKYILLQYSDIPSCATMATYNAAPAPYYLMVVAK
jgi:hypothetical protein